MKHRSRTDTLLPILRPRTDASVTTTTSSATSPTGVNASNNIYRTLRCNLEDKPILFERPRDAVSEQTRRAQATLHPPRHKACRPKNKSDRNRGQTMDNNTESGKVGPDGRGMSNVHEAKPPKSLLACPFYKYNSMLYMGCVRLRLTRVRDVKQHLNRRHRSRIQCPTCGEHLRDRQAWESHISARSCARPAHGFSMQGITEDQSVMLRRRVNRTLDESSQWFSIWRVLFPDSPLPPSPYLQNSIEDTLCMVHDYWRCHGNELIAEISDSMALDNDQDARAATLTSNVVETLLVRLHANSRTGMGMSLSKASLVNVSDHTHSSPESKPTTTTGHIHEPYPPEKRLDDLSILSSQQEPADGFGDLGSSHSKTANSLKLAFGGASVLPFGLNTCSDIATTDEHPSQDASFYSVDSTESSPYNLSFDTLPPAIDNSTAYDQLLLEEGLVSILPTFSLGPPPTRAMMCLDEGLDAGVSGHNQDLLGRSMNVVAESRVTYTSFDTQLGSSGYGYVNVPQVPWSSFPSDLPDDSTPFLLHTN